MRLFAGFIISLVLAAYGRPVERVNAAATVHQYAAGPEAILVNGYIIETVRSPLAVDAILMVSSATEFRRMIDGPKAYVLRQTGYLNAYRSLPRAALPDGIPEQETDAIRTQLEQRFGVRGIELLVGAFAQAKAASEW